MKISPVTFGNKIPIAQCRVKNNTTCTYEPATFYELDCQDSTDIELIEKHCKDWEFKDSIIKIMKTKYFLRNEESDFYGASKTFYILQKNDDEIIGISQIDKIGKDIKLDIIESSPSRKYKYGGQSIIASLGEIAINNHKKGIYIPIPLSNAKKFYSDKCGFKDIHSGNSMFLSKRGIKNFIKKIGLIIELKPIKNQGAET